MRTMRVLLLEWTSACGRPREILPEGFGMLRTLCSGFTRAGHRVIVPISTGLQGHAAYLEADTLIPLDGDPMDELPAICSDTDGVFVVAPESHGTLVEATKRVSPESTLLSCPAETVAALGDKPTACEIASSLADHLKIPEYRVVKSEGGEILEAAREIGLPAVVKPTDGAGCAGSTVLRSLKDCRAAVGKLASGSWETAIVQELLQGRHLSASFVATGEDVIPLTINTQSMNLTQDLEYMGGSCPYPFPADGIWRDIGEIVSENGFTGLMSMDFISSRDGSYFIEINPRMTTSCIGISKILRGNLASLITRESGDNKLDGYARWMTLPLTKTISPDRSLLGELFDNPAIVTPPFPVGPYYMRNVSKVLACVHANDSLELPQRMNQARSWLCERHISC